MATRRLVLSFLVLVLPLSSCAGLPATQEQAAGTTGAPATASETSLLAAGLPAVDTGMAAVLTRRLTASSGISEALAATREALALGGLSTWDGRQFLAEAALPAASGFVIPEEEFALAMEARRRPTAGRLTLTQLGEMLSDLGWPFLEGSIPGEQLRDIFQGWVTDGLAQPADPLSFTPLFLRDMALTQHPAIDLAKGDYDPEQLHLTLLELELLAAHFDRLSGPAIRAAGGGIPGLDLGFLMPVAQAAPACPELKRWLDSAFDGLGDSGKAASDIARIIMGDHVKKGLKEALQATGFTEAQAARFGKALSALSIAAKLWKLVALYTQAQVAVTVEENPSHAPSASEGKKVGVFLARAGVSDQDWQAYQQAIASSDIVRELRGCFRDHGLPVFPDMGDTAKETKDWHVEWRLKGPPDRFRINEQDNSFVHPGFLRVDMKAEGDHSAAALLKVEILPEKGQTHNGPQNEGIAVASAALHTAKPPSISVWLNAVKGGLGNILALTSALADLSAGWIAEMLPPKAYASAAVTYHESVGMSWSGRITYRKVRLMDKAESGRNASEYAFMLYNVDYWSETGTIEISRAGSRVKTPLEEIWDLSGFATVTLTEEHLIDNWQENDGCKGTDVATQHERNYSVLNVGGSGPLAGALMISNNGAYELNLDALPDLKGEVGTEYDTWWENKPCVEDDSHDDYSEPRTLNGSGISVSSKLDPMKPGVLSGRYAKEMPDGYYITITWKLKRKY